MTSRSKNAGAYVKTKDGKKGRTKNSDGLIDGKIAVYVMDDNFNDTGEKVLCDGNTLTMIGYYN